MLLFLLRINSVHEVQLHHHVRHVNSTATSTDEFERELTFIIILSEFVSDNIGGLIGSLHKHASYMLPP